MVDTGYKGYKWVYEGSGHWKMGLDTYTVSEKYSEQVLLIGGPDNYDMTDVIANIEPGQTYIMFPTGESKYDDQYYGDILFGGPSTPVLGAFRGLYFNPSPFGTSMYNVPNGSGSKPAYENGRRVMFWETMSITEAYWEWDKRGNKLQTNEPWISGKNCAF